MKINITLCKKPAGSILLPLVFIVSGFGFQLKAQSYDISTFAGNGTGGYSGDGGQATSAELNNSIGLAPDAASNIYIADYNNNCIRKVNTTGIISTFAGNGTSGYSGDGGPATSAQLKSPVAVNLDASSNSYIADEGNNRIRKVGTNGIISTIGGNGVAGYSGDGGQATSAELNSPYGVATDANGNIYIADEGNYRIRRINSSGIISTIAGNGVAGFTGDGGPATSAEMYFPDAVCLDASGNIYISDMGNNRIRIVTTNGIINTIAGQGVGSFSGDGGPATSAELNTPDGITVDASYNLYISDNSNERVRLVNSSGIITTIAGNGAAGFSGDGGPATSAKLDYPSGVAIDGTGTIYVSDEANKRIRKLCGFTNMPGSISGPTSVCTGNMEVYSIAPVVGATGYIWTLPSGWSGSSSTTSITVTVGSSGGNVEVSAIGSCGASAPSILPVSLASPSQNAKICYVTVDTSSLYNEVFWDKSSLDTNAIDSFRIYRKLLTTYIQVGSVSARAFPSFIDFSSRPNVESSYYEIGIKDTACGGSNRNSADSNETILLQASMGFGNVNLSWNAYGGEPVTYYRILRDSTGLGNWQKLDSVPNSVFAYTDLTPPASPNLQYLINTVWNLSCHPALMPAKPSHFVFFPFSSYSNIKKTPIIFTGTNSLLNASAFDVYPNPVSSEISIAFHQPMNGTVTIVNVLGQEVYTDNIDGDNHTIKQIQISALSQGVYILKLVSHGQTLIKKFVKI